MKTELSHDIIAQKVWERLPEQDKRLREVQRSIEQRARDFQSGTGSYLGPKELAAWEDVLLKLQLGEKEEDFIRNSRAHWKEQQEAEERKQREELEHAQKQAEEERRLRQEADLAKSEAEIQRVIALQNEAVAINNERRAVQRTRIALAVSVLALLAALSAVYLFRVTVRQKDVAQQTARQLFANDLSFKSQIALREGDRTTAYRLAEFAHRYVDHNNMLVTRALVEALYCNENSEDRHLPWASSLQGHFDEVNSLAFSPGGKFFATGSSDGTAKIWDLQTGKTILTLRGHSNKINTVAFLPSGKYLVVIHDEIKIKIWNLKTGKEVKLDYQLNGISTLAFSPSSKHIATVDTNGIARVWDFESKNKVVGRIRTGSVSSLTFSPDGNYLAAGYFNNMISIWDWETGNRKILRGHVDEVRSFIFSPDGKRLATLPEKGIIKIWDSETGNMLLGLEDFSNSTISIAFSPDGKCLATGNKAGVVKTWDLETGKVKLAMRGHSDYVNCVVFSPDGKQLATGAGSRDKIAKIWDLETNSEVPTLKGKDHVIGITFLPGGKLLKTEYNNKTGEIWDLETGRVVSLLKHNLKYLRSTIISPDRKFMVSGLTDDNETKIWDFEKGNKIVMTLKGHSDRVLSFAFSPDGKRLATGSEDNTVRIWEITALGCIGVGSRKRNLAGLVFQELLEYNLADILNQLPENDDELIKTNNPWQIKAFADLLADRAGSSNVLKEENPKFARASRLYDAALAIQDEPLIRRDYAEMVRAWARLNASEGKEKKAKELRHKADELWLEGEENVFE
jgi:WD40 repeat protein